MKNNGWKSYLCLEIVEKMNRFALLNFKIFWGNAPETPILGRGYGAPPQTSPPSALRRFALPCLARGLRPIHRPYLCIVDILRYFRPWGIRYMWDIYVPPTVHHAIFHANRRDCRRCVYKKPRQTIYTTKRTLALRLSWKNMVIHADTYKH